MAATKLKTVTEGFAQHAHWRKHVQTSALLKRLNDNSLAEKELMTAGQIASAKILLGKVLPDLKTHEISGHEGGPIEVKWRD